MWSFIESYIPNFAKSLFKDYAWPFLKELSSIIVAVFLPFIAGILLKITLDYFCPGLYESIETYLLKTLEAFPLLYGAIPFILQKILKLSDDLVTKVCKLFSDGFDKYILKKGNNSEKTSDQSPTAMSPDIKKRVTAANQMISEHRDQDAKSKKPDQQIEVVDSMFEIFEQTLEQNGADKEAKDKLKQYKSVLVQHYHSDLSQAGPAEEVGPDPTVTTETDSAKSVIAQAAPAEDVTTQATGSHTDTAQDSSVQSVRTIAEAKPTYAQAAASLAKPVIISPPANDTTTQHKTVRKRKGS